MTIFREKSIILAPLSGYTDIPFRNSARRHGCKYSFTEMIDAGAVVYNIQKTGRFFERSENEEWLGTQLIGADIEFLAKATKILSSLNFDILDFNLGCPVKKVLKKGEGAALGRNPDKAAAALATIVENSKVPVTAKIRILHDSDPEPSISLAKKLQDAGAKAITVHGRTLKNLYTGPVRYDIISEIRSALDIPVIANGGIKNLESYETAIGESGCSSVMIATGAMGNPWIFDEMKNGKGFSPPTLSELADEIEQHVAEIIAHYGSAHGFRVARKITLDYLSGRGFGGELKKKASAISSMGDLKEIGDSVRKGTSPRYWKWLESNENAPRRLRSS